MDIAIFLPFLILIGAMFLMSRSAKNRQRQAEAMRDSMEPGTGIRTIGGLYARVKEVHEDTVLLEVAPGVHTVYAKTAVAAVLDDEEYDRLVNGELPDDVAVPDDASSLTEDAEERGTDRDESSVALEKNDGEDDAAGEADTRASDEAGKGREKDDGDTK